MTVDEANRLHASAWREATATYGAPHLVPWDVVQHIGDRTRAYLCLASSPDPKKCPDRSPAGILTYYGFTEGFIDALGYDCEAHDTPTSRASKHKAAETWWHKNVGAQIRPQELADAVGWSYNTAINYINDNVTIFFPVKRGLYEIRDPKVERERERAMDG